MEAPNKIFLSVGKEEDWKYAMWTEKSPDEQKFSELDKHQEYIRKNALLGWLNEKVYEHNEDRFDDGFNAALGQVIDKINSL